MSRTPEQRSWDTFKSHIRPAHLRAKRIEDMAGDGTPDVIIQNTKGTVAWIENKALPAWPKRGDTLPLANAFEPGQVPFLRSWCQWGGHAFVLLRVETLHYLLDPVSRLGDLREQTCNELVSGAIRSGTHNIIEYLERL